MKKEKNVKFIDAMQKANLTPFLCADYLGVNKSTISRYVNCKREVPKSIYLALEYCLFNK